MIQDSLRLRVSDREISHPYSHGPRNTRISTTRLGSDSYQGLAVCLPAHQRLDLAQPPLGGPQETNLDLAHSCVH